MQQPQYPYNPHQQAQPQPYYQQQPRAVAPERVLRLGGGGEEGGESSGSQLPYAYGGAAGSGRFQDGGMGSMIGPGGGGGGGGRGLDVDVSELEASPLASLGRAAGRARKGSVSVGTGDTSASTSTSSQPSHLRPFASLPSAVAATAAGSGTASSSSYAASSPLVFNSFRASVAETDYTSSIYSTGSADDDWYFGGRRSRNDDEEDDKNDDGGSDDDDKTERGDSDDEPETVLGHGAGPGGGGEHGGQDQLRPQYGGLPDFTTSSRLSRMMDESIIISPVEDNPGSLPFDSPSHTSDWDRSSSPRTAHADAPTHFQQLSSGAKNGSSASPPSIHSSPNNQDSTGALNGDPSDAPLPSLHHSGVLLRRSTSVALRGQPLRVNVDVASVHIEDTGDNFEEAHPGWVDEQHRGGGSGGGSPVPSSPWAQMPRQGASPVLMPTSATISSRPIKLSSATRAGSLETMTATMGTSVAGSSRAVPQRSQSDTLTTPSAVTASASLAGSNPRNASPVLPRPAMDEVPWLQHHQTSSSSPVLGRDEGMSAFPYQATPPPPSISIQNLPPPSAKLQYSTMPRTYSASPSPGQIFVAPSSSANPIPASSFSSASNHQPRPRPAFKDGSGAGASSSSLSTFSTASLPTRRAPPPPLHKVPYGGPPSDPTIVRIPPALTRGGSFREEQGKLSSERRNRAEREATRVAAATITSPGVPSGSMAPSPLPYSGSSFSIASSASSSSNGNSPSPSIQPPSTSELPRPTPTFSRGELHPGLYSFYSLAPASDSDSLGDLGGVYKSVEVSSTRSPSPLTGNSALDNGVEILSENSTMSSKPTKGPEAYLQLGIRQRGMATTKDDLARAAMYFQKAAMVDGGCPGGMLFWGLTLRSGWGVAKDERSGFKWLSKACESQAAEPEAQMNRPSDKAGGEAAVISFELVVAIFEVAQCFLHGWGCKKNVEKAISYLLVASKLGDVDAQLQLASCYLHGLGTKNGKSNKKEAAFWYRAAVAQGSSEAGLSWIYKRKYDPSGSG